MQWVRERKKEIAIAAAILVVAFGVGAWVVWSRLPVPAPIEETETPPVEEVPIIYGPDTPKKWAWTDMPWRNVTFTPPAGHWVYFSEWKREFWIIPGAPVPTGAPAPDEKELFAKTVAIVSEARYEEETFLNWEDLELTMAQFACARGETEEDYVVCKREPSAESRGTNPHGLPFHAFRFPKLDYKTRAPIGVAPFTVVRLGEESTFGLVVYAIDASRGTAPARAFVQSLKSNNE